MQAAAPKVLLLAQGAVFTVIAAYVRHEGFEEDALNGPTPGTGFAPKFDDEEEVELKDEMGEAEEVEEIEAVEVVEVVGVDGHSRDLSIKLPKNMCLDEVFRLKVTLIKSEEFKDK